MRLSDKLAIALGELPLNCKQNKEAHSYFCEMVFVTLQNPL